MNVLQIREYVVIPALTQINSYSLNAEQLVMATGMAESNMEFIHQKGGGPARGLFQLEPVSHDDIWSRFLSKKPMLLNDLRALIMKDMDLHDQLHGNLFYAAAMCRIFYLRFRQPLPDAGDWQGMAEYWKKYYNTHLGAGTVDGFIQKAMPVINMYAKEREAS